MDSPLRITIVGAGAIGGLMAARLAQVGHCVSVIARGAHLEAMQQRGLLLHSSEPEFGVQTAPLLGSADPAELARDRGPQDLIVIGLKAHAIPALLPRLQPLLGPHTRVMPAINGVPWWYFSEPLAALDPQGQAARALEPSRILGCVVHLAAQLGAPGVVNHTAGRSLIVGEVVGPALRPGSAELLCGEGQSARAGEPTLGAAQVVELLQQAGFAATLSSDIRTDVWTKLIGNLSFNPVAALTGMRMDELCADPAICALLRSLIDEGKAVAAALGIKLDIAAEARIEMARALGKARISTLQDFEAGRRPELDALVGAVIELADRHQVAVPNLRQVYALARARAQTLGLLDEGCGVGLGGVPR
jgi:2-dehydropantoate 2-reductase